MLYTVAESHVDLEHVNHNLFAFANSLKRAKEMMSSPLCMYARKQNAHGHSGATRTSHMVVVQRHLH